MRESGVSALTGDLHVVLGASGGMGAAVASELGRRGLAVRAVSRGGAALAAGDGEVVSADVSTAEGARRAVEGATVVYHCAQPAYIRWVEEFPAMTSAVADACAAVGAKLVMGDNLYMYGPVEGPISEDTPQRPASRKGRVRKAMADDLLRRHAAGTLRIAIGRASDYFGPNGANSGPGALVFGPLAKGRKPRWLGRLDMPHTLHYLPDIGAGLVTLGLHAAADGRAWILPADAPRTGREWLAAVAQTVERPVRPAAVTPAMNWLVGVFVPMAREMNELMYQSTAPFVVDDRAFRRAFGDEVVVTPTADALRTTVEWFDSRTTRER